MDGSPPRLISSVLTEYWDPSDCSVPATHGSKWPLPLDPSPRSPPTPSSLPSQTPPGQSARQDHRR
ncbi:uncharacterized protein BO80DRAFT_422010 [Aspergillus ibericus CBS 121593]|uniref:Uncharacterized protein n=1 Tax=Aspergillus ibericus CBS 121593 TaxID=1448316 RepID=A0A395HC99_9EURO|nr:hypothetical protein BO80DRAFT_422010 [Aspergillus ibericus CBS 121593]RAL04775.1 hypothetical protein BO80DRAFT_422010 [Aspergillus ibericus CBS 121593]